MGMLPDIFEPSGIDIPGLMIDVLKREEPEPPSRIPDPPEVEEESSIPSHFAPRVSDEDRQRKRRSLRAKYGRKLEDILQPKDEGNLFDSVQ